MAEARATGGVRATLKLRVWRAAEGKWYDYGRVPLSQKVTELLKKAATAAKPT